VQRLPVYLRALDELAAAQVDIVSSAELGRRTGFSSEQIRKDLAHVGSLGTRGVGYRTEVLAAQLRGVLGLDRQVDAALVGAGHLGTALARYSHGRHQQVRIAAIFDADPAQAGRVLGGVAVRPAAQLRAALRREGIRMAVLAVPAAEAQSVADELVAGGVAAILNFAPVKLDVPSGVRVRNIDLNLELQALAYHLRGDLTSDGAEPGPRAAVPPL
jgi:redox-sensing transcriptional repressor